MKTQTPQSFLHAPKLLRDKAGFAMLFTILIVSLILTIAIGISDITLKQTILSNLAKDSGIAFYQADAAVECGMYEDTTIQAIPFTGNGGQPLPPPPSFNCGGIEMDLKNPDNLTANYYEYDPVGVLGNQPCFSIIFDKSNSDGLSRVDGSGFNLCAANPRQVERLLEVKY